MNRSKWGAGDYWNKWTTYSLDRIEKVKIIRKNGPVDLSYEPQYVLDDAWRHLRLALQRYSRGDDVASIPVCFAGLLDSWEESERLGKEVWSKREQELRHSWELNLHFYQDCFWLTGLALTLEIPDEQWQRLVALMGNEGEDVLLDSVIATRQAGRRIGDKLRFPKAYKKLLRVVEAPKEKQPKLLREYVEGWYASLKNAGNQNVEPFLRTPYWYTYGDENFEGGAYFGRWCIEAVAVAKAFNIDDSLCLDHPHYPGDLLKDGRSPRYRDDVEPAEPASLDGSLAVNEGETGRKKRSFWRRLLGGK